jgi:DNA/RNA endonuclease YhcR with UshA esterase domain
MVRKASLWCVAGAILMFTVPLAAHHSVSAEFDSNKPVTFTGKVVKVEWMNPHIYTHVEAKDPETGKMTVFKVEGGPPNSLFRQGWRKDTVKTGDTVSVSGVRAKIATSTNIGLATITTADGKRLFGSQGAGGARGTQQQ